MNQQNASRPRIRSREERESEVSQPDPSGESPDSVPVSPVDDAPASSVETSLPPGSGDPVSENGVPENGVAPEVLPSEGLTPGGLPNGELAPEDLVSKGVESSVLGVPVLGVPVLGVDDIKRMALAEGFVLSRERGPRKFRPDPDERGGVRMTCRLSSPVRRAMELARMDMNVSYSEIIEVALSLYLESRGFPVGSLPNGGRGPARG